jgi:hypothetical protein
MRPTIVDQRSTHPHQRQALCLCSRSLNPLDYCPTYGTSLSSPVAEPTQTFRIMIASACPSRRIVSIVSCALLLGSASLVQVASSFHSPATFHKPASSSWGQNSLITISPVPVPGGISIGPTQNEPSFGRRVDSNSGSSTKLMFMGSDGGFLGVGGPELVS